jgi:alcohol dehydrogenase
VLDAPDDVDSRGAMLLGSHLAGIAIELSMLGATHACANPLTARLGTAHGDAIAIMLPHIVRWNGAVVDDRYAELLMDAGDIDVPAGTAAKRLSDRVGHLAARGGLPRTLRDAGASRADLPELAADAATQWTGTFNPRPFDRAAALALYEEAF